MKPATESLLKQRLLGMDVNELPLQQGLSRSSMALGRPSAVLILSGEENEVEIKAKVGVFFQGVIAGCQCADDPSPADEETEYCELQVVLDKSSGRLSTAPAL